MNIHNSTALYRQNDMQILADFNKRSGLIGTVTFHSLLLLAFFLIGFREVYPPLEEPGGGFLVNLGNSETGLGEEEPTPGGAPEKEEVTAVVASEKSEPVSTSKTKTTEEILTQQMEESARIEAQKKKAEEAREAEEQRKIADAKRKAEEEKKKKADAISNMVGNALGTGTSTNQGIAGGSGNQGDPNGSPGVDNYGPGGPGGPGSGGPGGNGVSFALAGRKMVQKPVINEKSQDQGKVVVKIIVDKYGKVTKATAGEKGTTATSSYLKKISEEAALKTKFDANTDAAEEQVGTITFTYKLE